MKNKIVELSEISGIVSACKKAGETVVATSGCFDILHAGHVQYLEKAKGYGDILVIFLNSDESVKLLKGNDRPIVPEKERAEVLSGLGCVDYICIFSEKDPRKCIENVKPDIWVKGADYKGVDIPEKSVLNSYGGKIEYAEFKEGCSSTNIIEKIKSIG